MTNKHLGNQASAALQMDHGVQAELKDSTHQQCGWFSRNLLLALTVIGAYVPLCVCTYINMWECLYTTSEEVVEVVCVSFFGSSEKFAS